MSKHDQALAWAQSQVGIGEEPPGSNKGGFVEFCQAHTWLKGTGWPWCAAFAVTCVEEGAGCEYPDKTAGAWDLLARAQKRGWAVPVTAWKQVVPGDLVVFNVGSGHVGVVESIGAQGVVSIDGNASDQVKRCTRPTSVVRGFVHWPENLSAHKPSRSPFVHVVGSESGKRHVVVGPVEFVIPAKDKTT